MAIIRLAVPDDAAGVEAIYAPVVRDTAISFEAEPPSVEEMRRRIAATLAADLPWLVCTLGEDTLGYAYAARYRERAAYRWSVEVSVYVHPDYQRRGVGRALYTSLFRVLALQGFQNAYAGATVPNAGSVGLHTALGFQDIGLYAHVGYKLGAWHDVMWWCFDLGAHPIDPPPPLSLAQARERAEWREALAAGHPWLRLAED